jgi:hypothetical protein
MFEEVGLVQAESQLHQNLDELRQHPQAKRGMDDSPPIQNKAEDAGSSFDLEETAEIILPIDHPIFKRRHGSR